MIHCVGSIARLQGIIFAKTVNSRGQVDFLTDSLLVQWNGIEINDLPLHTNKPLNLANSRKYLETC